MPFRDVPTHRRIVELLSRSVARGTVPTVSCELHQSKGLFTKLAGVIGVEHTSAPAPVANTGLPPVAAASPDSAPPPPGVEVPPDPPKKKRGFWSRVFGMGRNDDKKQEEVKPPAKKKGGE